MILQCFNNFNSFIDFDPSNGSFLSAEATLKVDGMCDVIEDECIALYSHGDELFLQFGRKKINLSDAEIEVAFQHKENYFIFTTYKGNQLIFEFKYKPWWERNQNFFPQ